ncbi:MAG: hypothetical protein ACNI26_15620 [Terasakiella sp.]|uniref:hypothetical protein n=1 Tax=unclassified Terasakiella TaxID=2614952 RepID=UPI003AFFA556
MRAYELYKKRKYREGELNQEAEDKADLRQLMYADFEYINREQHYALNAIEAKYEEIEHLKDEISLMIDKAEISHDTRENVRKMAMKRVRKIMKD